MIDWTKYVDTGNGYMRLTDYCNSQGPKGCDTGFTTEIIFADEFLLFEELGDRVGRAIIMENVEGWNPLFDLALAEEELSQI